MSLACRFRSVTTRVAVGLGAIVLVTGLASAGLYLAFGRFAEGIEWLWRVLFAVPLFCAMGALAIGAYIRQSVIGRIRALDRAMQAHGEGRSAPLPTIGTDEIAVVARSVQHFMDEIARHREALENLVEERTQELNASAEQLRQSESRYRSLVELSPDITYRLDGDGRITFISSGIEAYGYHPDELVGRPLMDIVEHDGAVGARHTLLERRTGDRAVRDIEMRLRRRPAPSAGTASNQPDAVEKPAGDLVYVTVSARGRWDVLNGDAEKTFLGTQGVMHDLTERKRAEIALEQERERLFALLEGLPGTVCLHTDDYTMPYANRLFRELFGTPNGRPCYEVQRGRSEPCEVCDALQVLETGEPREWELTNPSGRTFRMCGYPFDTPEGQSMVLELGFDVTEHRSAEQQVRQAQAELAHMDRVATMGQLASSLAHELNQPLAGILSNAQAARRFIVRDPPDVEEVHGGLDDIVSDARRAAEVIRRTRALLKRGEIRRKPININKVIAGVAQIMQSEVVIRGISLTLGLAENLPLIRGDRVQLQQVILNLMTNGVEAMSDVSERQRELEVRTSMSEAEGVQVSVRDRGVGIAAEELDEIFDAFYTTKATGLGMGLAITRNIVQAHGGHLWAKPNPDRGMTFFFTVPAEA